MASRQWAKRARNSIVGAVVVGGLILPGGVSAALPVVSPGCDATLIERLDWAQRVDAQQVQGQERPELDPTEQLRDMYTLAELCDGEVVHQGAEPLYGPKASGVEPPATFQPVGVVVGDQKARRSFRKSGHRGVRGGRALSCTNSAYSPQFASGQVRGGGRSACNQTATITVTACLGRYFQSTGNTDQQSCNPGTVTASAATAYSYWYPSCSTVISYRSNFYGATGNDFSLYYNGANYC